MLNILLNYYALVAQTVKDLPAMQETQVQFLGRSQMLLGSNVTLLAYPSR